MAKLALAVTLHLSDFDTTVITTDELVALRAFGLVYFNREKMRFEARLLDGAAEFIRAYRGDTEI